MGAFYSGTMPAALAPEGIEIVGAFKNGDLKSRAHFIAGLCLQPWPQKELNRGRVLQRTIEIVGAFYSGAMRVASAPEGIETVGAFCNGDLKSWAHFTAGLCLQPWPQKD